MEQEAKHLKYFKVENFKCFESFEMEDIGQFNLIVGDNNVGKTSVLEALLFDEDIENFLSNLLSSLLIRYNLKFETSFQEKEIDYLQEFINNKSANEPIRFLPSYRESDANYEYNVYSRFLKDLSQDETAFYYMHGQRLSFGGKLVFYKIENEISNFFFQSLSLTDPFTFPFIGFGTGYSSDLLMKFSKIQESSLVMSNFLSSMSVFIDKINDARILNHNLKFGTDIKVRIKDTDPFVPLSMYGEGVNKLFRILCEIPNQSNKRLMIDEVDTGVHYSRFKNYMKTILNSAKENNVQLFMTTHSLECMKYFKEALVELGENFQKEARHFLLKKLNNGNIKSYSFDFSQFENALEVGNEIRN